MEKTPDKNKNKRKRTPLKLFNKSPKKLEEFNVQIINNFVKITPSKSNVKIEPKTTPTKSQSEGKLQKQTSILQYTSPIQSAKVVQAREANESTPVKNVLTTPTRTPKRTKLDFTDCSASKTLSDVTNVIDLEVEILDEHTKVTPSKSNKINNTQQTVSKCTLLFKSDTMPSLSQFEGEIDDGMFEDDFWETDFSGTPEQHNLNLTQSQHCKILGLQSDTNNCVVIKVQSTKTLETAEVKLEDFWSHVKLKVGDLVHVSTPKKIANTWVIDNYTGLLVYEPDLLISSTTVVSTLFCKRRRILAERFQGSDPENKAMVIGTLVHNLLQSSLKRKSRTLQEITEIGLNLLKSPSTIRRLYVASLSQEEIEAEILQFVPRVKEFMDTYVSFPSNKTRTIKPDNWKGFINEVDDIEENIWCPELGLKGKIDVSVDTGFATLPLELKTGRASVSLEHRGQVILYVMMMNQLGLKVNSGLLLYLKEGVLKEVPVTPQETRDLTILRNELAYYLTGRDLPEPINNKRACEKCELNIICTSFMKREEASTTRPQYFKNLQSEVLNHLTGAHIDYFLHWTDLFTLEASNSKGDSKSIRNIYTVPPEEREKSGRCLIGLKITNTDTKFDLFEHTFEKTNKDFNFLTSGISEGQYIVISTGKRPAVAMGFVTIITSNSLVISLDRNLIVKYKNCFFCVDTYDSISTQFYSMGNLTTLLENNARSKELREIVIDKAPAISLTKLHRSVAKKAIPLLRKSKLNPVQQRAVLKAIATENYLLIKGMPGTGKTQTIVTIIQLLVELGKSVLITSHTHSAVDNVCLKLQTLGIEVLRLGTQSKINEKLKACSEYHLTKNCTTPQQIEEIFNKAQVIGVTCLGSGHALLSKRQVDFCLVDESTQVLQPTLMRSLHFARAFVLIGDPDQLPPVVRNPEAVKLGMSESLFERLNTPESTISLNINYRMNKTITKLANDLTYKGELLIGGEALENATLILPKPEKLNLYEQWIKKALETDLSGAVKFIDTGKVWKLDLHQNLPWILPNYSQNSGYINLYEISVVLTLVNALFECGVSRESIGIIAPYRAQVSQFTSVLNNVDISTVDQFQGKDKEIIFYSCTRSRELSDSTKINSNNNRYEILNDHRRLNVAITRAKRKLIIVGDVSSIETFEVFNKLISFIKQENIIKLESDEVGFNWNSVLNF